MRFNAHWNLAACKQWVWTLTGNRSSRTACSCIQRLRIVHLTHNKTWSLAAFQSSLLMIMPEETHSFWWIVSLKTISMETQYCQCNLSENDNKAHRPLLQSVLEDLIRDTGFQTLPHSPLQRYFLPVSCPHRKLPLRVESEEEFVKLCRAKEKELEGIPCLYASLEPEAWAGTDDLIRVIKDRILEEQKKTVWVEQDLL